VRDVLTLGVKLANAGQLVSYFEQLKMHTKFLLLEILVQYILQVVEELFFV
jgi:hypothetical protein